MFAAKSPIPPEVYQMMLQAADIREEVAKHMGWTEEKTAYWFCLPNPGFGGVTPWVMVAMGRGHKVKAFIKAAKEGWAP